MGVILVVLAVLVVLVLYVTGVKKKSTPSPRTEVSTWDLSLTIITSLSLGGTLYSKLCNVIFNFGSPQMLLLIINLSIMASVILILCILSYYRNTFLPYHNKVCNGGNPGGSEVVERFREK